MSSAGSASGQFMQCWRCWDRCHGGHPEKMQPGLACKADRDAPVVRLYLAEGLPPSNAASARRGRMLGEMAPRDGTVGLSSQMGRAFGSAS